MIETMILLETRTQMKKATEVYKIVENLLALRQAYKNDALIQIQRIGAHQSFAFQAMVLSPKVEVQEAIQCSEQITRNNEYLQSHLKMIQLISELCNYVEMRSKDVFYGAILFLSPQGIEEWEKKWKVTPDQHKEFLNAFEDE